MNEVRRVARVFFSSSRSGERGLTLIEVLLAVGILAAIGVTFLLSMATSSRAVITGQEQVTAEGLAKSQMEYIKRQDYRVDGLYAKLDPDQIPANYDIDIEAVPLNPRGDTPHNDDGLQMVTIAITHSGDTVYTLEGYKCLTGQ